MYTIQCTRLQLGQPGPLLQPPSATSFQCAVHACLSQPLLRGRASPSLGCHSVLQDVMLIMLPLHWCALTVLVPPMQHRKTKKEELEEQAGTIKAKAKRFGNWFGSKASETKDVAADNLSKATVRSRA